jgi:hypothetical protein
VSCFVTVLCALRFQPRGMAEIKQTFLINR